MLAALSAVIPGEPRQRRDPDPSTPASREGHGRGTWIPALAPSALGRDDNREGTQVVGQATCPRRSSLTATRLAANASRSTGMQASGLAVPHMKMSTAA